MTKVDLVVRGGTVFDGTGGDPREADIAINDGRIVEIGRVTATGREEVEAKGRIVTPGFVDIHTHYDGQAIWSDRLDPSSLHGVTTVVMGNCGVGFAPCKPTDHYRRSLIDLLEGVEDIPEIVMTEGLTWNWESYPDYLDAVEARPHDIDLAAYIPHSALRIAVMGDRGARREPATPEDIARMAELTYEAVRAGAIGFSTSRLIFHRTAGGDLAPSFDAAEAEIGAIADALRKAGRGVFQLVTDFGRNGAAQVEAEFAFVRRIAERSGGKVTYSTAQKHDAPQELPRLLELTRRANADGLQITGQFLPRPMGIVVGHSVSLSPFSLCPTYQELKGHSHAQRIAELRKEDVKSRILNEMAQAPRTQIAALARDFERMFPLTARPDYEPRFSTSVAGQARASDLPVESYAYDALLEDDGQALWFVAFSNYADGDLGAVHAMLRDPNMVLGVGDGGAHYGMICDASYPTTMLTHWTRDRTRGERIGLSQAVRDLTSKSAAAVGLMDRGVLAVGYKADVNVIDYDRLSLGMPCVIHDLPGGGKRINQTPFGYEATIVNGQIVYRNGEATDALPGRLVRR